MLETPNDIDFSADCTEFEMEASIPPDTRSDVRQFIDRGWPDMYARLFGSSLVDVMAEHHIETVDWHWNARLNLLNGKDPEYFADFPKWARGHMKSTLARRIAVVDAILSYGYGKGGYCLYFSGTEDKASKHAVSIEKLLTSDTVREMVPALAVVQRSEEGSRSLGWKATFFYTQAGYIYHFGSLQSGLAGANVEDLRPTMMIPDDIDDRKNSVAEAKRNTLAFTNEILPMGKSGTLTLFAQNLISRFSVMYQIHKNKLKVLTNRRPSDPIPAVNNLEIEYKTVGPIITPFISAGTATWENGMPIPKCEEELHRMGESAFRAELQHEVGLPKEGLMHKVYDDNVHPISYSQFASVFGSRDAWKRWNKTPFSDWARTKTEFHANVAGYLAVSSANSAFAGATFCVPLSFPADTRASDVACRLLDTLQPLAYADKTWSDLVKDAWAKLNTAEHYSSISERLTFEKSYYSNLVKEYSQPVLKQYKVRQGGQSHSEDQVREMFNEGFGFEFEPSNPRQLEGIEAIDEAMRVDKSLPHIFDPSKMGYTRWYVLCEDDLTQHPEEIAGLKIYPPKPFPEEMMPDDLHNDDLFRWQMSMRRYAEPKLTELGERIDVAEKLNDDFGQALQMIYSGEYLSQIQLTDEEVIEHHLEVVLPAKKLKEAKESGNESYAAHLATSQTIVRERLIRNIKKDKAEPSWDKLG